MCRCLLAIVVVCPVPVFAQVEDVVLIPEGALWRYFKGLSAPPSAWKEIGFGDGGWLLGATGIGYGDGDDATVLSDMQNNYASVFMRYTFQIEEPVAVESLALDVIYDDGFAANLNGDEVERVNLAPDAAHDDLATDTTEPSSNFTDLGPFLASLEAGANVLAIEVHNGAWDSSDLSMIPVLSGRVRTDLVRFTRGDANGDGAVTVSDATFLLRYLFEDGPPSTCPDTEDVDDSGRINLVDAVYLLANLFVAGPPVPEPRDCGFDPTWEGESPILAECTYDACP